MAYTDLAVGQSAETARTVTEADIVLFGGVTGDLNPAHFDQAWAEKTRFGGRIAHGMLTAGYVSAVLAMKLPGPGTIYLSQTLRFTRPVRIGDTVTARVEVLELAGRGRVRLSTTCTNQDGEAVLDGEATVLVPD